MRILTVRQPWASAIIFGGKDVENRSRNIAGAYRGPVAIHAAISATASITDEQEQLLASTEVESIGYWLDGEPIEGGVILGVVDLVGVHTDLVGGRNEAHCSPWAEPGMHHLVLANPRPLPQPIPYRGMLGLRELDATTTALVNKAIA